MPSTQQANGQNTRGAAMNKNAANKGSTEAEIYFESRYEVQDDVDAFADHIDVKENFHDSGFLDDAEISLYDYAGSNDFVLFDNEVPYLDEDYFLTDNDTIDIASIKPNHGSIYNGTNNSNSSQIEANTSYDTNAQGHMGGKAAYDPICEAARVSGVEEEDVRPQHQYSSFDDKQTGMSSLEEWTSTFERHESIAYRVQLPSDPSHVFQQLQSRDEDIDLEDIIRQPFY